MVNLPCHVQLYPANYRTWSSTTFLLARDVSHCIRDTKLWVLADKASLATIVFVEVEAGPPITDPRLVVGAATAVQTIMASCIRLIAFGIEFLENLGTGMDGWVDITVAEFE